MTEQISEPRANHEDGGGNEAFALRVQQGDSAALEPLWLGVQRLVYDYAFHFFDRHRTVCASAGVEIADLQQEAFFAVCDAAKDFDLAKGWRFTTYLNFHLQDRFNALLGFRGSRAARLLSEAERLDKPLDGEDGAATVMDLLPDEGAQEAFEDVERKLYREQLHAAMSEALDTLRPMERQTVTKHYFEELTREQIGRLFGCDAERVRQIETNALQHLRRPGVARKLRPFAVDYGAAYEGTGWGTWNRSGSVEERLIERKRPK